MVGCLRSRLFPYAAGLLAVAAIAPASAGAATDVHSRNWAGYAVTPQPGAKFRKVSGTWVVKKPDCGAQPVGT